MNRRQIISCPHMSSSQEQFSAWHGNVIFIRDTAYGSCQPAPRGAQSGKRCMNNDQSMMTDLPGRVPRASAARTLDLAAPRVSIITAAYNAAHCLPRAVQSALAQTEQDIEIIVVDDGSHDQTCQVAAEWARADQRVRTIFLPENRGPAHALNRATQAARGKWIALLDADDWYEPTRLELMIDAAEAEGAQMVADNQYIFDIKAGQTVGLAFRERPNTRIGLPEFFDATDPVAPFDFGMLKPIFLASYIRDNNLWYRENVRHGYDYWVLLDFFMTGGTALVMNEAFYWYVQPFGTISRKWAQKGGRRYPFEHIKAMNDSVIEELKSRLAPEDLAKLARRGKALEALARLHQLREQLGAAQFSSAWHTISTARREFWTLCVRRATSQVARLAGRRPGFCALRR